MVQAEYDDVEKISNQSQEHPDVEIRTKDFNVEKNSNQSQVEGIEVSQIDHLFIIEDNKGRREFILDSPVYSIGRDPKCDIRLVSDFVSRRHATLVKLQNEDGSFYYRIIDGNLKGKPSGNGLLINGRKLRHADLKDEDEIVFGPQVSAIYYLLRREVSYPDFLDEFDITLIAPNHWSLDND
ncbi:MAG: FHA domain-containing protein [Scytolyngbya sp. HA4215-MV1]|nr:FHA domain-containing protein [Scytolyngbya sp. HA4215-MV1]